MSLDNNQDQSNGQETLENKQEEQFYGSLEEFSGAPEKEDIQTEPQNKDTLSKEAEAKEPEKKEEVIQEPEDFKIKYEAAEKARKGLLNEIKKLRSRTVLSRRDINQSLAPQKQEAPQNLEGFFENPEQYTNDIVSQIREQLRVEDFNRSLNEANQTDSELFNEGFSKIEENSEIEQWLLKKQNPGMEIVKIGALYRSADQAFEKYGEEFEIAFSSLTDQEMEKVLNSKNQGEVIWKIYQKNKILEGIDDADDIQSFLKSRIEPPQQSLTPQQPQLVNQKLPLQSIAAQSSKSVSREPVSVDFLDTFPKE